MLFSFLTTPTWPRAGTEKMQLHPKGQEGSQALVLILTMFTILKDPRLLKRIGFHCFFKKGLLSLSIFIFSQIFMGQK